MTATHATTARTALVTGATGYIGGLLVPRLLEEGWSVRVLTRRRQALSDQPWRGRVDVVEGDAQDAAVLSTALNGIRTAYFLIHSMGGVRDFADRDRRVARTFADAAAAQGVRRIVYLSGLHPEGGQLSPHLASRVEVGDILLASGVPTTVLQAAVVLGHGSMSFDMLRYLAGRLPVMVAPKWLHNRIQPIGVDDVVHYLACSAELPEEVSRTFDIGGPEVLTYSEMLKRFAQVTGLRRRVILTVPVLTPHLASHWVRLVTPLDTAVAKPLVGSLVHEVVCREHDIRRHVPEPAGGLTGFDDAVRSAMQDAPPDTGPHTLAVVAGATALSALLGALATTPDSRWYRGLDLPRWQPPKAAFPIVWSALYADIAATSAMTLTGLEASGQHGEATRFRRAFAANLALNTAWSVLFWRVRRPGAAAVEAAVLAASSADLVRRVAGGSRRRAWALSPYAVWTGFAAVLTTEIARRNGRR